MKLTTEDMIYLIAAAKTVREFVPKSQRKTLAQAARRLRAMLKASVR